MHVRGRDVERGGDLLDGLVVLHGAQHDQQLVVVAQLAATPASTHLLLVMMCAPGDWLCLPPEMRSHIVRFLDPVSEHLLACTARDSDVTCARPLLDGVLEMTLAIRYRVQGPLEMLRRWMTWTQQQPQTLVGWQETGIFYQMGMEGIPVEDVIAVSRAFGSQWTKLGCAIYLNTIFAKLGGVAARDALRGYAAAGHNAELAQALRLLDCHLIGWCLWQPLVDELYATCHMSDSRIRALVIMHFAAAPSNMKMKSLAFSKFALQTWRDRHHHCDDGPAFWRKYTSHLEPVIDSFRDEELFHFDCLRWHDNDGEFRRAFVFPLMTPAYRAVVQSAARHPLNDVAPDS